MKIHFQINYRQQELFAKAREEQAAAEQAQWLQLQAEAQMSLQQQQQCEASSNPEDGEYSWMYVSIWSIHDNWFLNHNFGILQWFLEKAHKLTKHYILYSVIG